MVAKSQVVRISFYSYIHDIAKLFQNIRQSIIRPLNPDSLGVTLTFETPATFDKFKRQLTGGEIKIPCIYPEPPQPIEYRMLTESKDRLGFKDLVNCSHKNANSD